MVIKKFRAGKQFSRLDTKTKSLLMITSIKGTDALGTGGKKPVFGKLCKPAVNAIKAVTAFSMEGKKSPKKKAQALSPAKLRAVKSHTPQDGKR